MNFAKEVRSLPKLIKGSTKEFQNVVSLCSCAMLTALNVVVGTLFISITPTLRIGFSSLPAAVSGMYYGPLLTGFAGVIADTLKYLIRPDGPYFPGFAINEFITGMIYGCFFYKKEVTLVRVILARLCVTVFINLILTSLWLNIMYQTPLMAVPRIIKNVIMFPIDTAILYFTLKTASKLKH